MADGGVGGGVDRTRVSPGNMLDWLSALGGAADFKGEGAMTIFFLVIAWVKLMQGKVCHALLGLIT